MKSIIQTITTLLIVVITLTSAEFVNANTASADTLQTTTQAEKEPDFDRIERSIVFGLQSDVPGILESTFFNVIAYKTLNPEFESNQIGEKITQILAEEGNHVVRYKAMLTLYYLRDQQSFDYQGEFTELVKSNDQLAVFQSLNDQVRDRQLATQGE